MKSFSFGFSIVTFFALLAANGDALAVPRSIGNDKLATRITTVQMTVDTISEVPRGGEGGGGTATIPNEVFNLVKSIVGAGVLSLPAGKEYQYRTTNNLNR